MKKFAILALALFAVALTGAQAGEKFYLQREDGRIVKMQTDTLKAATPSLCDGCDCGCAAGGPCKCAEKAKLAEVITLAITGLEYEPGDFRSQTVCGADGNCYEVTTNTTGQIVSMAPKACASANTMEVSGGAGSNACMSSGSGGGGGRRGRRVVSFLFPRVSAVHQSRVANGTALIARGSDECPPQAFGTPAQTTFQMPSGPVAAVAAAPKMTKIGVHLIETDKVERIKATGINWDAFLGAVVKYGPVVADIVLHFFGK
jgi:hypothetical protein